MRPVSVWTDKDIEQEIERIESAIRSWASDLGIWYDCGFKSHLHHFECEPPEFPMVTLFYSEGIEKFISGEFEVEFMNLLDGMGYWFECLDSVTIAIYTDDEVRISKFRDYFHWRWVCSLLTEDTGDVYEELYSHFGRHPEDLHKLHWREFEILLYRIFQNHGYKALLGPGTADGGVDIRIWQENPLGDILTVVQAKRFSAHRKIEAVPVQALYGVSKAEGAAKALFVTTSCYTPAARRFAGRVSAELKIAEKEDIVAWCAKAQGGVVKDKSTLVARSAVEKLIVALAHNPDARVIHGSYGYNMIINSYAVVIKETKHAALIMAIGNKKIADDGYGTRGSEVPLFDANALVNFGSEGVRRAVRSVDGSGRVGYWDGKILYTAWDRKPNYFDYMD
ncbi:restriction endonuclease [Pseudomonas nitrititolerans]|nr:restriction endonuclease [Stutzerimonas nitrititolerans]